MERQAYVEQVYHVQVVQLIELRTQSSWAGGGVWGCMPICMAETQPANLQEESRPCLLTPSAEHRPSG